MGVIITNFRYFFMAKCSDQGVDGETLQTLVAQGSVEQLRECGLLTIKQQMQLKKFIQSLDPTPTPGPSPSTTTSSHTLTKLSLPRKSLPDFLLKKSKHT